MRNLKKTYIIKLTYINGFKFYWKYLNIITLDQNKILISQKLSKVFVIHNF